MNIYQKISCLCAFVAVAAPVVFADGNALPVVTATAAADRSTYAHSDTAIIAIDVTLPELYHLYANPLGPGIGKPLLVHLPTNPRLHWVDGRAQLPTRYTPDIGEWVWAYQKRARFFVRACFAPHVAGTIVDTIRLEGLICHSACTPFVIAVPFSLSVARGAPGAQAGPLSPTARAFAIARSMPVDTAVSVSRVSGFEALSLLPGHSLTPVADTAGRHIPKWDYSPTESVAHFSIGLAILLGMIAGLLLNFMPCVLPVLGIKILSFSQNKHHSKAVSIAHSLVFAGGMLIIFAVLASLAAFARFSWGGHFQNPAVLSGIIVVTVLFSLGLFDFYTWSIGVDNRALKASRIRGFGGDLFRGMLTAILATPCSGPFLGATLAWTLRQPTPVIYAVFLSIGSGMALPHLLLSSSNRLRGLLPKPGRWTDDFKHLMGFFLLGVAAYLMIGLPGSMAVATTSMSLVALFAIAIFRRYGARASHSHHRIAAAVAVIGVLVAGFVVSYGPVYRQTSLREAAKRAEAESTWQEFSTRALTEAHMKGQHVIVDFTASWCMNCQYNTIAVLHTDAVESLIRQKNILALEADITSPSPVIESLLHTLGSQSVPFLAVFPGDDPFRPIIMRDLLSKTELVKVLKKLANK